MKGVFIFFMVGLMGTALGIGIGIMEEIDRSDPPSNHVTGSVQVKGVCLMQRLDPNICDYQIVMNKPIHDGLLYLPNAYCPKCLHEILWFKQGELK